MRHVQWIGIAASIVAASCTPHALAQSETTTRTMRADAGIDRLIDALRHLREPEPSAGSALPAPFTDDDFPPRDLAKEELGRQLFYDKILSGNQNISCATCHHALTFSGDGLSLSVGEGGIGLGSSRETGEDAAAIHERVPRNAPPIYNLGAQQMVRMFHDGRLEVDASQPSGFFNPAGDDLPLGLDNVLAAQAMFPVTSAAEMAGDPGENSVADAVAAGDLAGPNGVWAQLTARVTANAKYVELMFEAYPDLGGADEISMVHIANAIAAFEAASFRADDSPFDRYLRGDLDALSPAQERGMNLFYGAANCASCHSGTLMTNQEFVAIAMPQLGPGKGDNLKGYSDGRDDFGRERVTGDLDDRYRFRVPPLRNVALTGPWGHAGAFDTLEATIRHHLDPVGSLMSYDAEQTVLPFHPHITPTDFMATFDPVRRDALAALCELEPIALGDDDVADLVEFMHALTDRSAFDTRHEVPHGVPSGLPIFE